MSGCSGRGRVGDATGVRPSPSSLRRLIRTMSQAESALGRTTNSRRAPEAWPRRLSGNGRQVHGASNHAAITVVAHVPRKPRPANRRRRLLRRADRDVPALFVLVILAHDRRRIVHIAMTTIPRRRGPRNNPRSVPWNEAPRYLVHDRDVSLLGLGDDGDDEVTELLVGAVSKRRGVAEARSRLRIDRATSTSSP